MPPYFFGYGSLVNRTTHDYPDARPAQLRGWRRSWVRTASRDVVFLTVIPDATQTIDGLIAAVPNADWAALDLREGGYARQVSGPSVQHDLAPRPDVAHYVIPQDQQQHDGNHVILLSYLDVVVQGFLREFGETGVARFFETTSGWDTPIRNDRHAPVYSRHRQLTGHETALVDHHLAKLSALVE